MPYNNYLGGSPYKLLRFFTEVNSSNLYYMSSYWRSIYTPDKHGCSFDKVSQFFRLGEYLVMGSPTPGLYIFSLQKNPVINYLQVTFKHLMISYTA